MCNAMIVNATDLGIYSNTFLWYNYYSTNPVEKEIMFAISSFMYIKLLQVNLEI